MADNRPEPNHQALNVMQELRSLLAVTIMIFSISCSPFDTRLSVSDIKPFTAASKIENGQTYLRIRGLVTHSSYAVRTIESRVLNSELLINVYLCKFQRGLSAGFDFEVLVPSSVDVVIFGIDRTNIWLRSKGGLFPANVEVIMSKPANNDPLIKVSQEYAFNLKRWNAKAELVKPIRIKNTE